MENNLNLIANGSQPQNCNPGKTTSIFWKMEDNLIFLLKMEDNLNFLGNETRTKLFGILNKLNKLNMFAIKKRF